MMLSPLWRLLCAALLIVACDAQLGMDASQTRVIGGHTSAAPPYFAGLHKLGDTSPFCGGSLISPRHVLTAAHCVTRTDGPLAIWPGVGDLHDIPEEIAVTGVRVHPRYNARAIQHDLAVLTLAHDVSRSDFKPIALADAQLTPPKLQILGFGNLSRDDHIYPDTLQSAEIALVPYSKCQSVGGPYSYTIEEQICAGDLKHGERDSCDGDSGGPLIRKGKPDVLFGIVSWGVDCGRAGQPGVYTRVSSYREWIEAQMDIWSQLDLSEKVQMLFYFPLYEIQASQGSQPIIRRFTAAYQHWQESPSDPRYSTVKLWQQSFAGEVFTLELLSSGAQSYRLRLHYSGKVYEVPAPYTELTLRESKDLGADAESLFEG